MALNYHSQVVEPWGRTPRLPHQVARPQHQDQLPGLIAEASGTTDAGARSRIELVLQGRDG